MLLKKSLTGLVLEVVQKPEQGILLREKEAGKVLLVAQFETLVAAAWQKQKQKK